MKDGLFVSFEGGEGSGKTSIIPIIYELLVDNGLAVTRTNDPGGTPLGSEIRSILLDKKNGSMAKNTELYLYHASRCELIDKVIQPSLSRGEIVLCDRFFDSTWVYQGYIRGWSGSILQELDMITNKHSSRFITPDMTFICDVNPEIGLVRSMNANDIRTSKDGKDESRWEIEGVETHTKINNAFLKRAQIYPSRFNILDSNNNSIEQMAMLATKKILEIYEIHLTI